MPIILVLWWSGDKRTTGTCWTSAWPKNTCELQVPKRPCRKGIRQGRIERRTQCSGSGLTHEWVHADEQVLPLSTTHSAFLKILLRKFFLYLQKNCNSKMNIFAICLSFPIVKPLATFYFSLFLFPLYFLPFFLLFLSFLSFLPSFLSFLRQKKKPFLCVVLALYFLLIVWNANIMTLPLSTLVCIS